MSERVYWGEWDCADGFRKMVGAFAGCYSGCPAAEVEKALASPEYRGKILFAIYSYPSYEGEAFVLFRRDGKLYEVHASHCSCNGLEGQWKPEETTADALHARFTRGKRWSWWGSEYPEALVALFLLLRKLGAPS